MKYVIKIVDRGFVSYIGSGTYFVNNEKYVVLVSNVDDAKRYKTYRIAKNAFDKLQSSCVNLFCDVCFVSVDFSYRDRYLV